MSLVSPSSADSKLPPAEKVPRPLAVVATMPFLSDFVSEIGGQRVQVTTLLTGMESEHTYTPKPDDIRKIREAAVLVQVGLGLEIWINGLVRNAKHKNLILITSSKGIPLLRDVDALPGRDPDHHGLGNPHVWLDPERAKTMVRNITDGLIQADPDGRKIYQQNQGRYLNKLDLMTQSLQKAAKGLRHRQIITHHPAWPYFAKRLGVTVAGVIQHQVGSEPSANHLAELIRTMKRQGIHVIVSEPQLNPKVPETLARETGAKIIILTPMPGGVPGTDHYLSMMRYNIDQILSALQ